MLDEIAIDPEQTHGPPFIHESLALKGKHIPRYEVAHNVLYSCILDGEIFFSPVVEATMCAYAEDGFEKRKPSRRKITRRALVALGPNAEWSLDGFDKLLAAGFAIYGIRDI